MTTEEAFDFAKSIKADVVKETSAKENTGITELFYEIGHKLYKKHKAKVRTLYISIYINLMLYIDGTRKLIKK